MPTVNVSTLRVETPPKSAIVSNTTRAIPAIIVGFNDGIIIFLIAVRLLFPRDLAALKIPTPTDES